MLELGPENLEPYLRQMGWVEPRETVRITLLTGGVSNVVLRVLTPRRGFILKQSRPQLRTRDAWYSDIGRIWREMEVMRALAPYFPEDQVPRVLYSDRENYAFAMSHAPFGAQVWKEKLLQGRLDVTMGEHTGDFLGRLHQASAEKLTEFNSFTDITIFDQLRIEPFYRRVQERRPETAGAIEFLLAEMRTRKEALCHGDYTPKNMLVHDHGFTLVDYETAHLGDPTMDLGLFLAHLLLKAVRDPIQAPQYFGIIDRFWTAYGNIIRFQELADLKRRGIAHLGALLLARIDGTSPVDYLPEEEKRGLVRNIARAILFEKHERWTDVVEEFRRERILE